MKSLRIVAVALCMIGSLVGTTSFVMAQEVPEASALENNQIIETPLKDEYLLQEFNALKLREKDPETGTVMRIILRLKLRQIENQLNIKKALK